MKLMKPLGFRRRVPESRNVLNLNNVITKVTAAVDALKETAEAAGVDLSDDMPHLERELDRFFATRHAERDEASAVIRASEAGW